MRIYRMTATFGKLEHQTLTLKPGLNIITAPNEWGKSTWCAFLLAMLYGMDTRAKSTKSALADKERYIPWSGAPMEGRMDLNWQGRDITIERRSTDRVPLGKFSAYETATGLPIPELTAANCGQTLLGVEQSVFRRSGFIRLADLPVTQDEALRRRLNDLVTTGDDSGNADRLADSLKELRNKIRYHRTGLLPQAEQERTELEDAIAELENLEEQCQSCTQDIRERREQIDRLNNHLQALEYIASLENADRSAAAREDLDAALKELKELENACAELPSMEEATDTAARLRGLLREKDALQVRSQQQPQAPKAPLVPAPFEGMSIKQARLMLKKDQQAYVAARRTSMAILLILVGILGLIASGMLVILKAYLFAIAAGAGSLAALIWGVYEKSTMAKLANDLQKKYGTKDHSCWSLPLTEYDKQQQQYIAARKIYQEAQEDFQVCISSLTDRLEALCGSERPEAMQEKLAQAIRTQAACQAARKEAERAQAHYDALQAVSKAPRKPAFPDEMTHSAQETEQLLNQYTQELHQLQNRLGQYQGRMESLGQTDVLQRRLALKRKRILQLENTYTALVIAQDTLAQAKESLQRRFAPKITQRAQELLSDMTDGRYSTLAMDTDFSLRASADREDTLRDTLWRSDGTIDQLYLALRLAVAEILTPDAPLILDDALVRFDDQRMKAAVQILDNMSQSKQILLFSCQDREQTANP